MDEILSYAATPGTLLPCPFLDCVSCADDHPVAFLAYLLFCFVTCTYLIYRVVPTHGTKTPLVYLTICSLAGSVSVMAIKVSVRPAWAARPGVTGQLIGHRALASRSS